MTDSGGIFISYRRDDTAPATGRLADLLMDRFGPSRVFMDVDTIGFGQDFVHRIERAVGGCDVLLAPIGRRWLDAVDEHGRRRIDDPDDFVAAEIGTALRRGVPVVPILVDGASMVRSADLPAELTALSRRHATTLDRSSFAADAERIIDAVQRVVDTADLARDGRRRRDTRPTGGAPDPIDEIAAVLAARNRRRTRRWWATFLVAVLLVQSLASTLAAPPVAERAGTSWTVFVVLAGGLVWCVAALRREIGAQRLLAGQLPTMAAVEPVRRAIAPGRVRVVAVICVVAALVIGLGVGFPAGREPAAGTTATLR